MLERLLSSQESANTLVDDGSVRLIAEYRHKRHEGERSKKNSRPDSEQTNEGGSSKSESDKKAKVDGDESILLNESLPASPLADKDGDDDEDDSDEESGGERRRRTTMSTSSSTSSSLLSSASEDGEISVRITVVSEGRAQRDDRTPDVEITYSGLATPKEDASTSKGAK